MKKENVFFFLHFDSPTTPSSSSSVRLHFSCQQSILYSYLWIARSFLLSLFFCFRASVFPLPQSVNLNCSQPWFFIFRLTHLQFLEQKLRHRVDDVYVITVENIFSQKVEMLVKRWKSMLKQFSAQEVDKPTLKALALQEWPNFRPGNDMIFTPQQKSKMLKKQQKKPAKS